MTEPDDVIALREALKKYPWFVRIYIWPWPHGGIIAVVVTKAKNKKQLKAFEDESKEDRPPVRRYWYVKE